jgi:hypothetical protein
MGHPAGMEICRRIGVELSDVVVSNAQNYYKTYRAGWNGQMGFHPTSPYPDVTIEQLQIMQTVSSNTTRTVAFEMGENREEMVSYWLKLGLLMEKGQLGSRFDLLRVPKVRSGVCFQFAALVAYHLVKCPAFRVLGLDFDVVKFGYGNEGHYSVVVGRAEESNLKSVETWGADAFVFDPWNANQAPQSNILGGRLHDKLPDNPASVTEPNEYSWIDTLRNSGILCTTFYSPFGAELIVMSSWQQ